MVEYRTSVHCAAREKPRTLYLVVITATLHGQNCKKANVQWINLPAGSLSLHSAASRLLIIFSKSASHPYLSLCWPKSSSKLKEGTKRPASYSQCQEQVPDYQNRLFERFTGNADSCVAYLFYTHP